MDIMQGNCQLMLEDLNLRQGKDINICTKKFNYIIK